jgi:FecR protein
MSSRLNSVLLLCLAAASAPVFGANTARPGTLNYVEGTADLAGQPVTLQSVGSAEVAPGQTLSTDQGKAEILLTPGVFLRLGDNSDLQMVSPDLTNTTVRLERGHAMVEVDQIYPQNNIQVVTEGARTQLLKVGLYDFDANRGMLSVYDGEAAVQRANARWVVVKSHRQFALSSDAMLKAAKFDVRGQQSDLYNWSSLRSEYLATANSQIAGEYAGVAGFAPGWYWNPYFWDYTYIGLGPLWSPFGWGFFPPGYYGGGFFGYGLRPGYGVRSGYGMRAGYAYAGQGMRTSMAAGGFAGGGFHGGGGGGHR